jgi:hypothetical protein
MHLPTFLRPKDLKNLLAVIQIFTETLVEKATNCSSYLKEKYEQLHEYIQEYRKIKLQLCLNMTI